MLSSDFKDKVVLKPWGAERLLRSNAEIELWHLKIKPGQSTSFHCHPTKKTGLLVLSGKAKMSFMNDSMELGPLGKVMLRPGLFHQTACISDQDLELLEIETPPDKSDLVRMYDPYGRAGKPYESPESYVPEFGEINLDDVDKPYRVGGCILTVKRPTSASNDDFMLRTAIEIGMVLAGGLVVSGYGLPTHGKMVLSAGDVVGAHTFNLLRASFPISIGTEILVVERVQEECMGQQ